MSCTNGGIFSPLPYGADRPMYGSASHYPGSPPNTSERKTLVEGRGHSLLSTEGANICSSARVLNKRSEEGVINSRGILTGTIVAAPVTSPPSPLTVSARDIEAGSMDFTELATGMNVSSASSSQSRVQQQDWRTELLHQQKESLGTPRRTSSPAAPIKVRVSARKLKEIRSPYVSGDGSPLIDVSCQSTPSALTPPDAGVCSKEAPTTRMSNTSQGHPSRATQKSLKQGILQKVHQDTPPLLDASDNSLVITTGSSKDRQRTSQKLLEHGRTKNGDSSRTAESKIRIIPIATSSQRANSRVSIGLEEDTVNVHSRRLPGGQDVTQFPGDNAHPGPQAGVMSVGPISNLPLQGQSQTLPYVSPRDYVGDGGVPHPVQVTSRASNAAEVVPASEDVLATAKLVATCAAAATAAVLASSGKPHCIHEGSNTPVKSHDRPPADYTINTFPHSQEEDMPHNKYGTNGDIHGKKPIAQVDENNAVAVHKRIPVQEPLSLNATSETGLDTCGVVQTHILQNTAKNTKGEFGNVEERLAGDLAKNSKVAPGKHMSKCQLERGIHSPSSDRMYSADILKRLQRLEELQHARTMDTVERTQGAMDSKGTTTKDAWMAENSKLLLSQPLKAHTSTDDTHSSLFRHAGKSLADQCFPNKDGTASVEPPQSAAIIPEKHVCDVTHPGNERKQLAARMTVSNVFPVSKAASANSEGARTDDEIQAITISKAGRVLSEVQAARDRLEMQCALLEAENQLVNLEQLSQALCVQSADISSPLCELKVTEFISSLQQQQHKKKAEEKKGTRNEEEEGSEAGIEEGGHSRPLSMGGRSGGKSGGKGGCREGKQLKACGHNSANRMMKFKTTGKGTKKTTSPTRTVAGNKAMGTKQNEGAGKQQCTTKASSQKEEVSSSGSLGSSHLCTASGRQQQETAYSSQYKLQGTNNPFSTLNPVVHPPSSNCLHSGLTTSQPFPMLPSVQAYPLQTVPAGAHHHTAFPVPTMCYPLPPTVSFKPHPFQPLSTAIPLGAPRTTPPTQDASCLSEDFLREGRVTKFGDTRTFTEHEVMDACLQTSIDMHSHPPANLVVESLPGVHIEGDQQRSKLSFQAAGDLAGPHNQQEDQLASEECSSLHPHTYTAVEDIASATTEGAASEEAMMVSVEGHRNPSPPSQAHSGPLFPPHPPPGQGGGEEGETISAGELDEKLRAQMESKALEWVQQELLVRVLAQADLNRDPSLPHPASESTNSCSTCSPHPDPHDMALAPLLGQAGMQLFVDAGVPVDSGLVEWLVREVIQEQATMLLREMREGGNVEGGASGEERSSEHPYGDLSYTPPEPGSTPLSTSTTPLLSTPQPTPPPSPKHTPRAEESATMQLSLAVGGVATPTATPPPSVGTEHSEELLEDVDTPQATEDETEVSGVMDTYRHVISHGVETTGSVDHTYREVPTPSATPPPQPISPGTPPQSTESTEQVLHHVTPAMHTKEPSLSESSSSSSVPHKHTLTPTPSTTTTDRDISMGEYVLHRPPLPLANSSLSEGEVPLSPGDARWYALYSTKLGRGGPQVGKRKAGRNNPTVQAFIDLKSSPDPSTSDSSELSDSLQSETKQELGRGEIKRPRKHTVIDPFEKFLSKLNSSTPEDSVTVPATLSVQEDNTLSEMPSINKDDLSHGEVGRYETTPLATGERRRQKAAVPKFPLGRFSPGELQRCLKPNGDVTFSHSEGEVPLRARTGRAGSTSSTRENKSRRPRGVDLPVVHSVPSPGEVRLTNKTRNGVDIISISRESSRLFGSRSGEAASLTHAKSASVSDFEPSSPKLKIFESEPSSKLRVIQVQSQSQVKAAATEIAESGDKHFKGKLQPTDSQGSPPGVELSLNSDSRSNPSFSANPPPPTHPPLLVQSSAIAVTIPTGIPAAQSLSDSAGKDDSYTSEFDFSSISIPGFD